LNLREPLVQLELAEVRLGPGQEWDSQPNQWRFILVQRGRAYWLETVHPRELAPGELLVVCPASEGTVRASQLGEASLQWFGFRADAFLGFLSVIEREWIEQRAVAALGTVSSFPSTHPAAQEMAALCEAGKAECRPVQRAKCLVLAVRLLTESMPARVVASRRGGAAGERFDEIIARMPDAELIEHSSEELARLCGCTPRHFNRLFRTRFGSPTRMHQTELRLLKARQLLDASDVPVAEVAADCGYRSLSLFNSLFRRRFGMSPSEWRRRVAD
jgi:AraC-like DNA-binding protein